MSRRVRRVRRRFRKSEYENVVRIEEINPSGSTTIYRVYNGGIVKVYTTGGGLYEIYRVPRELYEKAKTMKPREWIELFYRSPRKFLGHIGTDVFIDE
ncbi:MAG: hypothetical protein ACK4SY_07600 [Pyrobaculum sp.]